MAKKTTKRKGNTRHNIDFYKERLLYGLEFRGISRSELENYLFNEAHIISRSVFYGYLKNEEISKRVLLAISMYLDINPQFFINLDAGDEDYLEVEKGKIELVLIPPRYSEEALAWSKDIQFEVDILPFPPKEFKGYGKEKTKDYCIEESIKALGYSRLMKVIEVIPVEELELMIGNLKHMDLSFTEQAIIEKFVQRLKPRKAIMVDDLRRFIEKEIDNPKGEE